MGNPFDDANAAFAAEKIEAEAAARGAAAPARELVTVSEPGEYDLDEASYHADPCPEPSLSGSIIKVAVKRSPRHAWEAHPRLNPAYKPKESATFDMGSVFHKLILGKGAEIETFPAENWTKAGDKGRAFKVECRKRGSIPVLEHQLETVTQMARAVRAQIPGWEELHYAMAGGTPERTIIWREETPSGPIWCRCMLDWIPHGGNLAPDWKSTQQGAGPDEWGTGTLWSLDGDIQAAWNRRALKAALGREVDIFFAVAEMDPPHALACMRPTPGSVALADKSVQWAINVWGMCLARNRWPGYRREMAWVETPYWKERSILEREERGGFDVDLTRLQIEALGEAEKVKREGVDDGEVDVFGLRPIPEEKQ